MKQYRITSEHFVAKGETGEQDAVMHPDDLSQIKKLAGIVIEAEAGVYSGAQPLTNTDNGPSPSPVGSNITYTADYRNKLLDKYQAIPGSWIWFLINFEPVRGLGANAGSLEDKIEAYLKSHPKERPENRPKPPGVV